MFQKKISVIMGIYNCAQTLPDAIVSIINQTYTNWELILCDDGSTDLTYQVAKEFQQKYPDKIKLLKNESNKGLNYTLNYCLKHADGDFVARMDGDDLCLPERFEKQINFLNSNPDIAIVSTDMEFFDEDGVWGRTHAKKSPDKFYFLKNTPFCHAAAMVRKKAYLDVGGYTENKKLLRVEDYHLWVKMYSKGYVGMNIQECLYQMRDDHAAKSRRKFRFRLNEAYVKAYAIKNLKLPIWCYMYCLKPIIIGLLPNRIYGFLHKNKNFK